MRLRRHSSGQNIVTGRDGTASREISVSRGTAARRISVQWATQADVFQITAEFDGSELQNIEGTSTTRVVELHTHVGPAEPKTAADWVRQNSDKLRRYTKRWVAVTRRGVIASSDDFDDVYAKAKQRGVANPLVFRVPAHNADPKIVSTRVR